MVHFVRKENRGTFSCIILRLSFSNLWPINNEEMLFLNYKLLIYFPYLNPEQNSTARHFVTKKFVF
jgi:hypothetical protein